MHLFADAPFDTEFNLSSTDPYLDDILYAGLSSTSQVDLGGAGADSENLPLIVGQFNHGNYGNGLVGSVDTDGVVSYVFDDPGTDVTLYVQGFDIDTDTEVEVLVNNQSIGYLTKGGNVALEASVFSISASLLQTGQNTVTFLQTNNPGYQWGVTDVLVLSDGLNVSSLPIDPEFSDDGYVVWQDSTSFYLGIMDMESGALLSVVTQVVITPVDIRFTQQGPEIIETDIDGIGAIGVSLAGLVHYTETGATILAGTQGLEIGYMPKGTTPGLRFTTHDGNGNIYLYDNGLITPLDFNGGIVTSWLNESEFVVSYRSVAVDQIGIYDVDTGILTIITDDMYGSPAHQAAYTASDGVQYLALSHETTHDIWINDGTGWVLDRTISSPLAVGDYFHSPEFFEWNGALYIAGVASAGSGSGIAVPALYNVDTGIWTQAGAQAGIEGSFIDPEIVILNDGLAFYFSDITDPTQFVEYFFTMTPGDVLDAQVLDPTFVIDTGDDNAGVTWPAWRENLPVNDGMDWPTQDAPDSYLTSLEYGFSTTYGRFDLGTYGPFAASMPLEDTSTLAQLPEPADVFVFAPPQSTAIEQSAIIDFGTQATTSELRQTEPTWSQISDPFDDSALGTIDQHMVKFAQFKWQVPFETMNLFLRDRLKRI